VKRLHRHQLARLGSAGWARLCAEARDPAELAWLQLWAQRSFPLVVTQQPCAAVGDARAPVALGLAAPLDAPCRRIALRAALHELQVVGEFPAVPRRLHALPAAVRPAWSRLCDALRQAGTTAHVYGSHGWQAITGLRYVHAHSDIDLWASVSSAAQADAVTAALAAWPLDTPRLDGELMFRHDLAVAWREWQRWRAGETPSLLVKTVNGARLAETLSALVGEAALEAPP